MNKIFLTMVMVALPIISAPTPAPGACCKTKDNCCKDSCCTKADQCCKATPPKPCTKACKGNETTHKHQ